MIRLRLFGPIELFGADGLELRPVLAQPRRLALLAYLAAATGFQRRDVLLAHFWPEHDEPHARDALNAALSFLRRTLGAGAIVARGADEVGIDSTRFWCDVPAFRAHLAARRHAEALTLYRGDLLDGFHADHADGFAEWLERERVALRASAAKAARALAEARERDAHFTTAVASARRAVELSDADERVLRELLTLLDRLGDRAGALHAYDEFARRLKTEHDVEPSVETRTLVERLRTGDIVTASTPSTARSSIDDAAHHRVRDWHVERELGRGGMAVVYLARDVKHDRPVALKVMRPELASAFGAERFLREIRIMARLAHPHILPLLDSGADAEALYLVTPYVAGESLRDRLRRDGPLPLDDALRITRDVAAALDYAHRAGVVHRDIKPENILLQDGQALVADFGIALAISAAGTTTATGIRDTPLGTPAYMSPEQIAGAETVDGRADVYALGAVLYEMLTGDPPNAGPSTDPVIARSRSTPVRPVRSRRGEVPPHVDAAVLRALASSPAERFSSPDGFARALEPPAAPSRRRTTLGSRLAFGFAVIVIAATVGWNSWRHRARGQDSGTVLVLPFTVRAADSSLNYLREGALDVFAARLTGDGVPRALDARTTLAAYRRAAGSAGGELATADALALARNLGAGRLLTGEIVSSRDRTVMSARLVDVTSGRQMAEHTETGTGDALALTTRLATRLVAKSVGESPTRLSALSDSVEAVRNYLAGLRSFRSGRARDAFDQLSRALEIDPTFASAALWRTYTAWGAFIFGNAPKRMADSVAWSLRGRLALRDSLILAALPSIGPNYPAPSTALEQVQAWERAARANPDRADVWAEWAKTLMAFGEQAGIPSHLSIAAMAAERAVALDLSYARAYGDRSFIALRQRDTAAMRRWERRWWAIDSVGNLSHHWAIATALGDSARAESLFTRMATHWREAQQPGVWRLNLELWSAGDGLASTADAERLTRMQLGSAVLTADQSSDLTVGLFHLGALRGRVRWTTAYADSITGIAIPSIRLALSEPVYAPLAERAADSLARRLDTMRDPAQRANAICYVQLWRAQTGDTTNLRRSIALMRRLVAPLGPAPGWRVGNLGVCPLLLEAWLDRRPDRRWASPAFDRLEKLLLAGILTEVPYNLTYLIAARWRAEQGDTVRALRLLRHFDPMAYQVTQPARWRLEGRLAAAIGDTAGAVHAYQRFLEIRDQPDPGSVEAEVRAVRSELAALQRR